MLLAFATVRHFSQSQHCRSSTAVQSRTLIQRRSPRSSNWLDRRRPVSTATPQDSIAVALSEKNVALGRTRAQAVATYLQWRLATLGLAGDSAA